MKKLIAFLILLAAASAAFAQDKTTGGVKGTVKAPDGKTIANVAVEARQAETVAATARTNNSGDFQIDNLKPGTYVFVFKKAGLSEGVSKPVEIKAKTMHTLKRLILTVDEGSLALIRGSVFDHDGRIARNARVEIFRVSGENLKKLGERTTDTNGEFAFRLPSEAARYRFVVKLENGEPTDKDLDVNGAEVYRFAISLKK